MNTDRTTAAHDRIRAAFDSLIERGPSESLYVRPVINQALMACRREGMLDAESRLVAAATRERLEHFMDELTVGGRVPEPLMGSADLRAHLLARV